MRRIFMLLLLAFSLTFVSAAAVTGKVVGTDGKPATGVHVYLHLADEFDPLWGGPNNVRSMSLLTDGTGSFAAQVDPASWQLNFDSNIMVYQPGTALCCAHIKENGNVITLGAGMTINGTVVDMKGKPLAGIPVRLLGLSINDGNCSIPDALRASFTAFSAADGTWSLPGIPPDCGAYLSLDSVVMYMNRSWYIVRPENRLSPHNSGHASALRLRSRADPRRHAGRGCPGAHRRAVW